MYHKSWNNSHVIICLYVDDLLIFGSNMNVIDETKNILRNHFDMKDLGETNFILGIKITRTCEGIFLDQSHYVEKILKKYNFHDSKHVATPFDSSVHLFPVESENDVINQKEYASIVGSLRYVTDCTRPNIAYAVGVLERFTQASQVMNMACYNKSYEIFDWNQKIVVCSIKNILLYLKAFVMRIGTLCQVIPVLPLVMSLL